MEAYLQNLVLRDGMDSFGELPDKSEIPRPVVGKGWAFIEPAP